MTHPHLKPATEAQAIEFGLSKSEYQDVLRHMGRTPNVTELGIFSVMWSEHCSYKSSRVHLAKFPTWLLKHLFRELHLVMNIFYHNHLLLYIISIIFCSLLICPLIQIGHQLQIFLMIE